MQPIPLRCPACDNILGARYGDQFLQRVKAGRIGKRITMSREVPIIIACELGDGYWRNPDATDADVGVALLLIQDRTPFPTRLESVERAIEWRRSQSVGA